MGKVTENYIKAGPPDPCDSIELGGKTKIR